MKKNFDTRLKRDLFPEMPQSFADGLQNAAEKAGARPRKLYLRKVFFGAAVAVLAAACVAIAVFGILSRRNGIASGVVIPASEREEITALRSQYPDYFGLDASEGLKVYVWQMSYGSYSCALLSGADERSEVEIGGMKGTTIEEMRLILSTYGTEESNVDVEVVPFRNPISSYWYEIDKTYTAWVTWLIKDTPFTPEKEPVELPGYSGPIWALDSEENGVSDWEYAFRVNDAAVFDIDGDGRLETCLLTPGPTSGLYTVVFTAYRNGTAVYRNTFNTAPDLSFEEKDGEHMIKRSPQQNSASPETEERYYRITIEDGAIVLTDAETGETEAYWGAGNKDWNMGMLRVNAENRLADTWCSVALEPDDAGLLTIGFYGEKNVKGESEFVSFTLNGVRYEDYTYTAEAAEDDDALAATFTNAETGDIRHITLSGMGELTFETDETAENGERVKRIYVPVSECDRDDLPIRDGVHTTDREHGKLVLYVIDFDGDGEPERVAIDWDGEEKAVRVQIGPRSFRLDEVADLIGVYLIDLDPNDGRVNLLVSATHADGGERTYELHVENGELCCGHTVEGYCFLADSAEQELMLGTPTDLLGAEYGYREVRGEALEPADEWLQASGVIEAITFGPGREKNIENSTLLHLVRALSCEIDGKIMTLEPDICLYLSRYHESLDRIEFETEDGRTVLVRLSDTVPYAVNGVPLIDYFDNAPQN